MINYYKKILKGTGLHTFMMYLGPYIVKCAMIANECNEIPPMLPSRYNFETFAACSSKFLSKV